MTDQNSKESLRLLRAMRKIYSKAKRSFNFRISLALLIGIVSPLITNSEKVAEELPELHIYFAVAGIFLSIVVLLMKEWEKNKILIAAKIQEEFDVKIFQLEWNKILAGSEVQREIIISNSNAFKGDEKKLVNWYSVEGDLSEPKNTMLCQRENLSWDSNLKQRFAITAIIAALAFFIGGLALSILSDLTLIEYLTKYLATSLPAIIIFTELAISHFSISKKQKIKESEIRSLIKEKSSYSKSDLRKVQDYIFSGRKNSSVVPDWFYFLTRKNDQAVTTEATTMLNE